MALTNDSFIATPGASGTTVATHLIGGKEHQAVVITDFTGHLYGSKDTWNVSSGNTLHSSTVPTLLFDLFNATGSGRILRVRGLFVIPAQAAVTGVGQTYELYRTSAVGTGGTVAPPVSFDTANAALPAGITARTKAAGGATQVGSNPLLLINGSSEETSPYAAMASQINHIPLGNVYGPHQWGITVRENEGLRLNQTTSSAIGNVNIVMTFTVE